MPEFNDEYIRLAHHIVKALARARFLTTDHLDMAIWDICECLTETLKAPAEHPAISTVENVRGMSLAIVAKLTTTRRIDTFRQPDTFRWLDRVFAAVQVVEIEFFNAEDAR